MHNEQTLTPYLHKPFYSTAAQVSLHALTIRDVWKQTQINSKQQTHLFTTVCVKKISLAQLIKLPHHKTHRCNFMKHVEVQIMYIILHIYFTSLQKFPCKWQLRDITQMPLQLCYRSYLATPHTPDVSRRQHIWQWCTFLTVLSCKCCMWVHNTKLNTTAEHK